MWSHDNRDLRSDALEAVVGRKSGGLERRVGRWSNGAYDRRGVGPAGARVVELGSSLAAEVATK